MKRQVGAGDRGVREWGWWFVKTHITSHRTIVRNNDNYGDHDLSVCAERTITQHAIVIQRAHDDLGQSR